MRRRFNYTGRQRIFERDVRITVTEPEERKLRFFSDLDFKNYQFPAHAPVWIEVYNRDTVLRFPFGTVAAPTAESPCEINEFVDTDIYHFRVKVVDPLNQNRLLGLAKNINPTSDHEDFGPTRSLLRLGRDDLEGRPWRLNFPPGEYPILYLDNSFDAGLSLATLNIMFQGAVFPQVLEMILDRILIFDGFTPSSDYDEEDKWKAAWIQFAESLPSVPPLETDTEQDTDSLKRWINEAVIGFCRSFNAIKKIRIHLKEIES
jgi:hypothetical protein